MNLLVREREREMTRRTLINHIRQLHPGITLKRLKEEVRSFEALPSSVEEWIEIKKYIRKEEGEWALYR